ncbi:hypothetical protein POM88_011665 [Heracleum sosnowskyi]|uniref:Uncharacterized protein n=1 Tax=Heracleum sosnowskyi TaxID=360622 RepID=A0AAD8IWM9_9APIA|nr:hypothetical protein POM88_011665 [Heracleum sosnowskyi]
MFLKYKVKQSKDSVHDLVLEDWVRDVSLVLEQSLFSGNFRFELTSLSCIQEQLEISLNVFNVRLLSSGRCTCDRMLYKGPYWKQPWPGYQEEIGETRKTWHLRMMQTT